MKTTTKKSDSKVWDEMWTGYVTAKRAGLDLAARKAQIREWHEAKGWEVPSWAR